jgi:molecular chaperone GrpE
MPAHDKTRRELKEEIVAEEEAIRCEKHELARLEAKVKELEDLRLRQMAEFDNYKKHLDREKLDYMKCANEKLMVELLEVADNFERALPELRKSDPAGAEGMRMIYDQLMKILAKAGLKQIEAAGKSFNPYEHEAFLQEECEKDDGTVLEEMQKGYCLNGKVIRHSKVKVARRTIDQTQNQGGK